MIQSLYTQWCSEEQYSQHKKTLYEKFKIMMKSKGIIDSGEVMSLYNIVYSICASQDDSLRERLYFDIYSFITEQTNEIFKLIQTNSDSELLKQYNEQFDHFENGIAGIERACKYLSKHTIEIEMIKNGNNSRYKEIIDIGKIEWKKNIFNLLEKRLQEIVITIIKQIRNSECSSNEINEIKKYCQNLIILHSINGSDIIGLYVNSFENEYLGQLKKQTRKWVEKNIKELSMFEYLQEGIKLLDKEQQIIGCNLDSITLERISSIMSDELWKEKKEIINAHIKEAFNSENKEYVELIYKVFNKCSNSNDLLNDLSKEFGEWIVSMFEKELKEFVPSDTIGIPLMNLYIECNSKVNGMMKIFNGKALFGEESKKCLSKFLNSTNNSYHESHPKFIAQYVDQLLRGVGVGKDGKEIILNRIDQLMNLLQAVQNKDVFMHFNSNYLARRLINKTVTVDEDIDKSAMDGIRAVCGFEYAAKINHMIKDINNSVDLNSNFHELYKTPLYVNVLTFGVWPFSSENSFNSECLPKYIYLAQIKFEEVFLKKGKSKKLRWLNNLSKANILMINGNNKSELILPGIYFIILDLINQYHGEWKNNCKLPEEERNGIEGVLIKMGIIEGNFININYFAQQKRKRIVIGMQEINQITQENTIDKELIQSRKISLQAIIVRIMKQKKVISHKQLVEEIVKIASSKFVPSNSLIKESIEYLIEKEYMKRKEDDPSSYQYVY